MWDSRLKTCKFKWRHLLLGLNVHAIAFDLSSKHGHSTIKTSWFQGISVCVYLTGYKQLQVKKYLICCFWLGDSAMKGFVTNQWFLV
jgi:hypothetical protein